MVIYSIYSEAKHGCSRSDVLVASFPFVSNSCMRSDVVSINTPIHYINPVRNESNGNDPTLISYTNCAVPVTNTQQRKASITCSSRATFRLYAYRTSRTTRPDADELEDSAVCMAEGIFAWRVDARVREQCLLLSYCCPTLGRKNMRYRKRTLGIQFDQRNVQQERILPKHSLQV